MNKRIYFTNLKTGHFLTTDKFLETVAKWEDVGEVWSVYEIDCSEVSYGKMNAKVQFINGNYTRIKTIEMKHYPSWNFTIKKREGDD